MIELVGSALTVSLLSAACSVSEASIVGSSEYKVKNLVKQDLSGSRDLAKVVENRSKYLSTTIFLNTVINVGGSMLIGSLAIKQFDEVQYAMFVCFLTFFLLIFSEVKPKVYASGRPEKVGRFVAKPIIIITKLLTPIMSIISAFIGEKTEREALSFHEVKSMLSSAGDLGVINAGESRIAQNVFALRERKAKELIVADGEITTVPVHSSLEDAKELALTTAHKRIIAVNRFNQPVGVVLQRDILRKLLKKDAGIETVAELIYPIHTVKGDCCLSELAMKLYRSDNHLSVVTDDSGKMLGVVSLSNIQELLLT